MDNPPELQSIAEPHVHKSIGLYWKELVMMAILLVFFTLVLVGISVWIPQNVVLATTIGTVYGGISGALLTKLRQ